MTVSKEGSFLSILTKAGNDKELINATNHPITTKARTSTKTYLFPIESLLFFWLRFFAS